MLWIRLKYGSKLFSRFGDNLQSAIRVLTREPLKVPEFMNQEPKVVARFVAECLLTGWKPTAAATPANHKQQQFQVCHELQLRPTEDRQLILPVPEADFMACVWPTR
jgi:hypothetical protein